MRIERAQSLNNHAFYSHFTGSHQDQTHHNEIRLDAPGTSYGYFEIDDMMFLANDRAGQKQRAYRWPGGRIPFSFAPGYTKQEMNDIRLAMDYIQEFTCIRFQSKKQKTDQNFLYIRKLSGKCSSFVGNIQKGPQQVALDPDTKKCGSPSFPGHVLHELVHAIGFFHEHARNDRDNYIDIRYENLPDDDRTRKNYNTNEDNNLDAEFFGVPYNYGSIMHYSRRAGSRNGKDTIIPKKTRGVQPGLRGELGQREKLSYGDIKMIQTMYKKECPGSVDPDNFPDPDDIPDIEDWMEDRKLNSEPMPEMPVENITEISEGIVDEVTSAYETDVTEGAPGTDHPLGGVTSTSTSKPSKRPPRSTTHPPEHSTTMKQTHSTTRPTTTLNYHVRRCEDATILLNSTWMIPVNFSQTNESFTVRLIPASPPNCSNDIKTTQIPSKEHVFKNPQFFLDTDGNLMESNETDYDFLELTHLPHHFCIDTFEDTMIFRVCRPTCNEAEPCYRKCCPLGNYFNYDSQDCEPFESPNNQSLPLPVFNHLHHSVSNVNRAAPRVTIAHGSLVNCTMISTGWSFANMKIPFKILSNGSVVTFFPKQNAWLTRDDFSDYCVDQFHSNKWEMLCNGEQDVLLLCQNDVIVNYKDAWLGTVAKVTLIVALVALLLTAIIVFLIIDNVNLHSWTRLSFVTSEFIFLFLFSGLYSKWFQHPEFYPVACKTFAIVFHYAGLMTMCWLSVINFDLYWTFKVLKPSSSTKFDVSRFFCYVCFSFGAPLVVVLTAIGIQNSKHNEHNLVCRKDVEEQINSKLIYPDYGTASCSLAPGSLGAYWYGPLCFLLLANLIFFVATTRRMAHLRRMTRRASIDSTTGKQRQSNQIFLKIFIVSGVTWNVELIGWIFNVDPIYRLDIVHHLQAIAMFYIFVCRKSVLRSLQRKYPIITKIIPDIVSKHGSIGHGSTTADAGTKIRFGRKTSSSSNSSVSGISILRQESTSDLQAPI
ncbi:unnamed protein product [Allacma fusca]|uniref:Metalloendopeptidase n=1 Tax=Allacma fusca TaxID=39272 RepID=A0A8J2NP12_9HEXA|nr:unnamed protein product [Allacma fusca]